MKVSRPILVLAFCTLLAMLLAYGAAGSELSDAAPSQCTQPPGQPTHLEPPNGTVIAPGTLAVTVRWAAVEGATHYTIQGSDTPEFTATDQRDTTNTYFTVPGPFPADTCFYWRVMAHNDCGSSEWTDAWMACTSPSGTATPTQTVSQPTATPTETPIPPSATPTQTIAPPTATASASASASATRTNTVVASATATLTATTTQTTEATQTPTPEVSATITVKPSVRLYLPIVFR